jgi:hypothetical protein
MNISDLPSNPIALKAFALLILAQLITVAFKVLAWWLREGFKARHVAALATAKTEDRAEIEKNEPDPIPPFTIVAVLAIGSALALITGSARGEFRPFAESSDPQASCKKKGCSWVNGRCECPAEKRRAQVGPQSNADTDGAWMGAPIQVWRL